MDITLLQAAAAAVSTAREIGKAASSVRDFNQFATTVAAINDQLLKAQESLFTHMSKLMELQDEHFKTREELRKIRETLDERARYSLFEIAPGNFAYRVNVTPEQGHTGEPLAPQQVHYLCQGCFDKGVKSILGREQSHTFGVSFGCHTCKREIYVS